MNSSKEWEEAWKQLKSEGIDGFSVGVPSGRHPGHFYTDIVCDCCGDLIKLKSYYDGIRYCVKCKMRIAEANAHYEILRVKFAQVAQYLKAIVK